MKTNADDKERRQFDLAFDLAYYIHADREVAFFVAEDALDALAWTFSRQEKNRAPSERLRGFLKWGERTRPVRKTVRLGEEQMLQWLVFKQSEAWERQTECGEGLYLPNEDDMIVRYVAHLVCLTLRRGSFYVTLAVGALLHRFSRRETRLCYDVLTQNDPARVKDAGYIGKQRLELIERVSRRFGQMVRVEQKPGDEKQFVARETTQYVIELVNESLRRFAPWGTACAVESGFEVTDIPGLYFSETGGGDEEVIELNRVRAVIDPDCFARFAAGLSKYVRTLPGGDQDRGCDFDALDQRLAVPAFRDLPTGAPRGDRLRPPRLEPHDYVRLRRALDARSQRRRDFSPQHLCVYVDDVPLVSFDPKIARRVRREINAGAGVVEVRGSDHAGELTLATLSLDGYACDGREVTGSVVQLSGQTVNVRLKPSDGECERVQLEVSYSAPGLAQAAARLVHRAVQRAGGTDEGDESSPASREMRSQQWVRIGAAASLVVTASVLLWWWLSPAPQRLKTVEQAGVSGVNQPSGGHEGAGSREQKEVKSQPATVTPTPAPTPSVGAERGSALVARAAWSDDSDAALHAVAVEPTRGETQTINLSQRETKILLSLPLYDDDGRSYARYRLTLSSPASRLWQQTLSAPKATAAKYANLLSLTLFARQLPARDHYDLEIEGGTQVGWQPVGHLTFSTLSQ